jgi:hypothetical protein
MTNYKLTWSFSSLTKFETCPKQYYHVKVAKDIVDGQTEETIWGSRVHECLEHRVKDGTPLPEMLAGYEKLVAPIAAHPGEKLIEKQMAINESLQPTEWFADDAWCRGIVDVGVINGSRGLLLDYKTGKRKSDLTQLKLFAGLAFASYPELEVINTGFVWLKDNAIDKKEYTRQEVPMIWQEFIPRVQRMQRAYDENKFPPKTSGLCKKYCPVPKHKCEFSGRER